MIAEAIEKILSLGEIKVFQIGDLAYANRDAFLIKPQQPAPIKINTLTGILDYLKSDIDALSGDKIGIFVYSPGSVVLASHLDETYMIRNEYLIAKHDTHGFQFGTFSPLENFIVSLQSGFFADGNREAILRVVGNIKTGAEATFDDDGVTQTVTAKTGITRVENVAVPNPVTLRPFRTFPEIAPLASDFILRIRKGGGVMPEAALFECDGGAWELNTAIKIKEWLVAKLGELALDIPVIA
jgi:hypothetical protein